MRPRLYGFGFVYCLMKSRAGFVSTRAVQSVARQYFSPQDVTDTTVPGYVEPTVPRKCGPPESPSPPARQWLGADPATVMRTACQSLPLGVTMASQCP